MGEGQRLFGTDGIRGKAGESPLDANTVRIIGEALVSKLTDDLGHAPRIVIGRDTRESGPRIESELTSGAVAGGATVASAGVITTPGVAFVTRTMDFDAGVVISASHNAYQDNGIKVFSPSGRKLPDEVERRIEADVAAKIGNSAVPDVRADKINDSHDQDIEREYQKRYLDYLVTEVGRGLSLTGLKLGVDCANGSASGIAPELFSRLGAEIEVIFAQPDGRNINKDCGSLHQDGLQRLVIDRKLDLGISFDGDADRALFVDATGNLVDGDTTLLILADYLKTHQKLAGDLVVATVMSNLGLEIGLKEKGIALARAQVGDRFVLEELLARDAKLGGEQSGHIIFPDISLAGDGMITAIELLRAVLDSGHSFDQLAALMTRYPQLLVNIRVRSKPPVESLPGVMHEIESAERELKDNGRLLVRYSGTENLARVMIEGKDELKVRKLTNRIADAINSAIGANGL